MGVSVEEGKYKLELVVFSQKQEGAGALTKRGMNRQKVRTVFLARGEQWIYLKGRGGGEKWISDGHRQKRGHARHGGARERGK